MTQLLSAGAWLEFLHRGGNVAHFWCATPQPTSTWFDNNQSARITAYRQARDINSEQYVSINPSTQIPPHNKSGNTDPRYISKQIEYIQCINVLHCEFDGKDWCKNGENFYADPASYKAMAMAHIRDLPYAPTLIVDSGGGYHCYWYLRETVYIDDRTRQQVIDVQHSWVQLNGGDEGVSDITRVYRVLGTRNCKPGWKGNNPLVTAIEFDPHRLYSYDMLAEVANDYRAAMAADEQHEYQPTPTPGNGGGGNGEVRSLFNAAHSIVDVLMKHGYKIKYKTKSLVRMVRPGGETPSVSVLPPEGDKPEVAFAHNTGDALFGKARDAYECAEILVHNSDWKAAYMDAKKAVGLWEDEPKSKRRQPKASIDKPKNPSRGKPMSSTVTVKPAPMMPPWAPEPSAKPVLTKRDEWLAALNSLGHTFRLNQLEDVPEMDGVPLNDVDRSDLYLEMISRGVSKSYVDDVINVVAKANAYHPVQQYLNGLTWDGGDHLTAFMDHLTGDSPLVTMADGTQHSLHRLLISRWLIGCAARALDGDKENPFKHQTPVLVFVGGQEIGKSSIPRWLVSSLSIQYHQEGPLDPHKVEDKRSMITKWIWEVSELGSSLRRSDRDALKGFITQEWHTYRKPWGKGNITKPTLCNLVGTVNPEYGFLDDQTGNRRFLPVKITAIDHSYAQRVAVDQLWAQIVHMYRSGVSPNLSPEEKDALKGEHARHEIENPLQQYLQMYFDIIPGNEDLRCFTAEIVARLRAFNVALSPDVKVAGKQIAEALSTFGLERAQTSIGGVKGRVWVGISPNMKQTER